MNTLQKWVFNVLIGVDQLGNSILGGDPDETISSRIGKVKLAHGGRIPWKYPWMKVTDFILDKIDPNHSINSIEPDEGSDEITGI
jgi:hypothetical protein